MKIVGIATDFTFDMFKQGGYNFIAPVLEEDGRYFLQTHKSKEIYELIEMASHIHPSIRDNWLKGYFEIQERDGKDLGTIYNTEFMFMEYEPMLGDEDMLRKVDDAFHIQEGVDLSGDKIVMGFSLDEDVFIGNPGFIISQIEILIPKAQTAEEFDILYRIYGMAQEFEKMGQVLKEALDANLGPIEQLRWLNLGTSYEVTMQVEAAIKAFKEAKGPKGIALTKE